MHINLHGDHTKTDRFSDFINTDICCYTYGYNSSITYVYNTATLPNK